MVNKTQGRSWFHGIRFSLWQEISRSMHIPLLLCESAGEDYNAVFEDGLRRAQQLGAEACVFGDIDIEDHLDWCRSGVRPWASSACIPCGTETGRRTPPKPCSLACSAF